MSVHDALTAWRRGEISLARAYQLSGATSVAELDDLCRACDVEAVERGRTQIAAGQSHDMDDVLREMEEILDRGGESRSGRDF